MIYHGDCLEVMPTLDAESIDAIVTDPPYGLGFMGKAWDSPAGAASWTEAGGPLGVDHLKTTDRSGSMKAGKYDRSPAASVAYQRWCEAWAVEALRVAKPGAHLLAFGGTRTYHRLACAIEDAGWEIRDCLVWAYASGFPKSLDVSKAIDKAAGAERAVVAASARHGGGRDMAYMGMTADTSHGVTAPATPEAARWQGWGTALKPAWEPIILARKPLRGTVAANVLAHGTGALNIDGCRIGTDGGTTRHEGSNAGKPRNTLHGGNFGIDPINAGRWPANLILTDPIFDGDTPGVVGGGEMNVAWTAPSRGLGQEHDRTHGKGLGEPVGASPAIYGDSGNSRFFLIPKAARSDREPVLGGLEEREVPNYQPTVLVCECGERWKPPENRGLLRCNHPREMYHYEAAPAKPGKRANVHPTVKPLDLMRHLVRLVTPPGGVVLDPFLGSGTTALAAEMEGFAWIGIEKEAEYVRIAEARLNGVQRGLGLAMQEALG